MKIKTPKITPKTQPQAPVKKVVQKSDSTAKKQLEDLFRGVKKPKTTLPVEEAKPKEKESEPAPPQRGSADDLFGNGQSKAKTSRRVTEEGWPVYTLEEIGLSNTGGDTKDCPFDCNCCY